ncbi:hypothetical protein H4R34_002403 [Dimargaris verticillata]|uniref:Apoptosis-inducing factor 1, mitochondrial n=1 Tax=Dimargaris verticillata TaxID=2761393 RepID=A0A9W8EDL1_9FUNG|nr:hypothetical protein H4R34_002403 [Dimargaris verticillata]
MRSLITASVRWARPLRLPRIDLLTNRARADCALPQSMQRFQPTGLARSYATHSPKSPSRRADHYDQSGELWGFTSFVVFGAVFLYLSSKPTQPSGSEYYRQYHYTDPNKPKTRDAAALSAPVDSTPSPTDLPDILGADLNSTDTERVPLRSYYPYVLVGGGTTAYHALKAIRESDPEADVLIIGAEAMPPYSRPPLSKEMWRTKSAGSRNALKFTDWQGHDQSLFYNEGMSYTVVKPDPATDRLVYSVHPERKLPILLLRQQVTDLNVDKQQITLANGHAIQYGKVLLATGGTPRALALDQTDDDDEALAAVVRARTTTFRGYQDFTRLDELTQEPHEIVIVGGGFLGSELAAALAVRTKAVGGRVTQIVPEEGVLSAVLPQYLSHWTTERLEAQGVKVLRQTEVKQVSATQLQDHRGKDRAKLVLNLSNGSQISADHIVQAVGIEPNVVLAKDAGLEIDPHHGGIAVNAELQARTNVYAAGDVASYHDVLLGRRRLEHYDHAAQSGYHAGKNMCGSRSPYLYQPMFWSDLGPDVSFEAVGLVDSKLATVSVWAKPSADAPEEYGRGLLFYLKDSRIVGMIAWNLPGKIDMARQVVLRHEFRYKHIQGLTRVFNIHQLEPTMT